MSERRLMTIELTDEDHQRCGSFKGYSVKIDGKYELAWEQVEQGKWALHFRMVKFDSRRMAIIPEASNCFYIAPITRKPYVRENAPK